ncbi:hypothetical protein [Brachybacterium sp. UNK5269]|uniref:hypothetical protein n=1 Tax=Brachybacterium sp. UNK5269 TaxID=3408576 RepID=UPI003BAF3656
MLPLRETALDHTDQAVRLSGQRLSLGLEQLTATLRQEFLGSGEDPAAVIAAYAAEHQQPLPA